MTEHTPYSSDPSAAVPRRRLLGLPLIAVIGLALLTVPRVVLHDLGILHEGTGVNALFVFVPAVVWIVVVLLAGAHRPFLTVLVIGLFSGVILAVVHQLLWSTAFAGNPPRLGGNLEGLDPAAQDVIIRLFSIPSSLFTGALVGAVAGLVAWGLSAIVRRSSQRR
ncbi:hypothetical protein [Microbacterium sp.]|uniref:hypothetical protein n=1 Tax=Microbacterium sp. TaxID=51671 RepID=UPI003F9BBA7F